VPLWVSLLLSGLIVLAMGYLRLVLYPNHLLPLAYGVGLLVCLWHRNIVILYAMAIAFSAIAVLKMIWRSKYGVFGDLAYEITAIGMVMGSIWIETGVIHSVIRSRTQIEKKSEELERANDELELTNRALVANEAEIASQNEELQSQTEELEQQAEELRQQAEEMEHQSAELQLTNEELGRRERGLQTLLESARWLRSDLVEHDVMGAICQAAIEVTDSKVDAAAIVQERDGRVWMRGHAGFGIHGSEVSESDFSKSFAALVIEKRQTAFLHDLATREDLVTPQPPAGRPFRSVLAAPIWSNGRIVGAVELYSREPREWSEDEFSIADWLAAQTSLAIQTIEYQQELQIKRREAEEASIQKTRFLAAVSHDVRTPANAISLMADLVERMSQDPSKAGQIPTMVKNLKANARALVELVSDVLDLARFDSGKLDLQISEFSLQTVVEVEIRQFQHAAESRGLKVINAIDDAGIWIRSDKMKLARILANLVGNAVKFTDVGEIRVSVHRAASGEIHLMVSDTGVGMPAEQLPRIFDEFYQLQNPERDRNKGTGLGLAICRRLVESLGCTLSVESRLGAGTTFTIRIPIELAAKPASGGDSSSGITADDTGTLSLKGLHVMLVEDHDATRAATASIMASHGAMVTQASTCRSAIQLLTHEKPDVLLLDMMLPDRDGTDVLRHLQTQRPETLRCVLAVSGDVRPERVADVRRLGADDLLPKPLTTDILIGAITATLSQPAKSRFLDALSDQALRPNLSKQGDL
jgi:signal transduction histidine kinase/FixJ family two-component response regulator